MNQCFYKCNIKTERRILVRAGAAYAKLKGVLFDEGINNENQESPDRLSNGHCEIGGKTIEGLEIEANDSDGEEVSTTGDDSWSYPNIDYLRLLDPKEWKQQDHYRVLGLERLRIDATEEDIRRAYRRMLLFHHPDKRKPKGEVIDADNDYFTCITRAYEVLGTTKKRRAYDSVDPEFNNNLPTQEEITKNFYGTFQRQFSMNARWSETKNVPPFGNENSSREEVENFYSFWYNFKSWREYSYLDEEDKERGHDRDERRYIGKENKIARAKRKKEETLRIRNLVDLAYNNDKRVQRFKTEEKEKKLAMKKAKIEAQQAVKAEQERSLRAAELAKKEAEAAEQKRIEQLRIEKEQQKKAIKKERKILRDRLKEYNYYDIGKLINCHNNNVQTGADSDLGNGKNDINISDNKIRNIEGMEKICEFFTLTELRDLNKQLITSEGNQQYCRTAFLDAIAEADKRYCDKMKNLYEKSPSVSCNGELGEKSEVITNANGNNHITTNLNNSIKEVQKWSAQDTQLLVKAVNLFPAGTVKRWDVVTAYINQHSPTKLEVSCRDVLNKVKMLQNQRQTGKCSHSAFGLENTTKNTQNCSMNTTKETIIVNGHASNNDVENASSTSDISNNLESSTNSKPISLKKATVVKSWTNEEQSLLEQAMKTYPQSTPDRWDRVAECIPSRTKKECLRRVKELVELVNAKAKTQAAMK